MNFMYFSLILSLIYSFIFLKPRHIENAFDRYFRINIVKLCLDTKIHNRGILRTIIKIKKKKPNIVIICT